MNPARLFRASCVALIVTAMSFALQAAAGLETLGRVAVLPLILAAIFLLLHFLRPRGGGLAADAAGNSAP